MKTQSQKTRRLKEQSVPSHTSCEAQKKMQGMTCRGQLAHLDDSSATKWEGRVGDAVAEDEIPREVGLNSALQAFGARDPAAHRRPTFYLLPLFLLLLLLLRHVRQSPGPIAGGLTFFTPSPRRVERRNPPPEPRTPADLGPL